MSETVIVAEGVSKLYRIGLTEQRQETLFGALALAVKAPLRNWRRLRRLDTYNSNGQGDESDILWALRDVSFEVKRGEVLGIIGRNGAGKSTLLKILSRVTEPTAGRIRMRGRVSSLLEVGTGFHPELTGRENVYLNGTILGMTKQEIDRKFDEIVAFSGVEHFLDTPVKRYSSGMKVRLAFSVAAHLEPDILIVDEVLAVGDAEFQRKCVKKMLSIVESRARSVLLVSHSMATVAQLCDRTLVLENGKIAFEGAIKDGIDMYLRRGMTETLSRVCFAPDFSKPAQFVCVEIQRRDGTLGTEFSTEEPIVIELTVEVRIVNPGMYMAFYLMNDQGVRVLFSDAREKQRELGSLLQRGRQKFRIEIPPRLLGPSTYSLTIGMSNEQTPHLDHRPNVCGFTVREFSSVRSTNPGVIGVQLPWTHLAVECCHPEAVR